MDARVDGDGGASDGESSAAPVEIHEVTCCFGGPACECARHVPPDAPVSSVCSPLAAPLTLVLDRSHTGPFAAIEEALLVSYDTAKGEPSEEFKALVTTLVYSTNSGGEQGKGRGETCDFACTMPLPGRARQITGAIPSCDPAAIPQRSRSDPASIPQRSRSDLLQLHAPAAAAAAAACCMLFLL